MLIKQLTAPQELHDAYLLVRRTFNKTQKQYYSEQGTRNFYELLKEAICICTLFPDAMLFVGLYGGKTLKGVCICRDAHISMLFVDVKFQGKGIGGMLLDEAFKRLREQKYKKLTVYAAPNAVEFYRKHGFVVMGRQCCHDGIEYVPMQALL